MLRSYKLDKHTIMNINFEKSNGLVPAIIQDAKTNKVLMLGYMNQEALDLTLKTKKVTFYSRTLPMPLPSTTSER